MRRGRPSSPADIAGCRIPEGPPGFGLGASHVAVGNGGRECAHGLVSPSRRPPPACSPGGSEADGDTGDSRSGQSGGNPHDHDLAGCQGLVAGRHWTSGPHTGAMELQRSGCHARRRRPVRSKGISAWGNSVDQRGGGSSFPGWVRSCGRVRPSRLDAAAGRRPGTCSGKVMPIGSGSRVGCGAGGCGWRSGVARRCGPAAGTPGRSTDDLLARRRRAPVDRRAGEAGRRRYP